MSDPRIRKDIINLLTKEYPKDFSIKEVSEALGYNRGTISTYLKVLKAEGLILITRNFGKIKLYSIKKQNL